MFLWIWQLEKQVQKYGGIEGLINKLRSLNINDVCIKYHEGSGPSSSDGINFREDFLKYKSNFKAAGFRVGTWGYNYFNYVQAEANMIIDALNNSDYYIFDPEVDVSDKVSQAEQICQLVRNAHPQGNIGYSSFPIVSYHRDIPYDVFNRYCDFASPQVYWASIGWSVENVINKTLEDHKAYGLDKPIYPSIQSYNCIPQGYTQYDGYNFAMTGVWSLDNMDSTFEQYAQSKTSVQCYASVQTSDSEAASSRILTVKQVQAELNNRYHFGILEDDIFGSQTFRAIVMALQMEMNAQFNSGLKVDGDPGPKTKAALISLKKSATGNIVWLMQALLLCKGYSLGAAGVDGDFGDNTGSAVDSFQGNNGLTVDTWVGTNTWNKLLTV